MSDATDRYPQPREGITGTERTADDLLALDDKAIARRLLMTGAFQALWDSVLVGNPAPKVVERMTRMEDPRPGDLVVERGSLQSRDPGKQIRGFGVLLAHREEWDSTDEEWAAEVEEYGLADLGEERRHEHAWYVQYGPTAEDVCRWTDCKFIAIPPGRSAADLPGPGSST